MDKFKKLIHLEDHDDLINVLFDINEDDMEASNLVANEELAIDIFKEIIEKYPDINVGIADIDTYEYDNIYLVSIDYDPIIHCYTVNIEKGYSETYDNYIMTDGYVLIAEDVTSKYQLAMQKNHYSNFDIFTFEELDNYDVNEEIEKCNKCNDKCSNRSEDDENYNIKITVNDKEVEPKDVMNVYRKSRVGYRNIVNDILDDFFDEFLSIF